MNNKTRMKRGRTWQMMLLLALFAWLLPQTAGATYVDDTYRYSVMLSGSNTITIKAPVYDQRGADAAVVDGNLKFEWTKNGTSHSATFRFKRDGGWMDSDAQDPFINFWTDAGGSFDITQGNSGSRFTLTSSSGWMNREIYHNGDGTTYDFTAVWRVPYEMLGCTVKCTWDVTRDRHAGDREKVSGLGSTDIPLPKAQDVMTPQVTMATMSYSEVGKLELPWFMGSNKIKSVRYEYTDAYGIQVREDLPEKENNGTIYLDATVPHDNFGLVVSYKDDSGYDIDNIGSETQNLTMIHAPVGLTATPTGNHKAAVRLDWHIRHTGTNDITSSDFFEVQRSLTGQEADFVTIGSVPFTIDLKNPYFTFTDSTLVAAVTAAQLTAGSSLPNLSYRVRRMITQTWGWDGNPCAQRVEAPLSGIHLQRLKSYSARWEDERAYSVRVTWDYVDEPNAVWDDRAKMMMVVTMKNSAGQPTDTLRYELTADERADRTKVLDFSRPCLKYDIRMFVDPGTSPLRSWDLPDAMRITSAADWDAFCQRVKDAKGQYDVNAVLCADITTSNYCGADGATYRGTFDGNGHTLTYNKQNYNQQYVGPFYSVGDATIRNLHTAGTITSSQKFIGGITAWSNGNTIIENCRSSVNIGSTVSGDATNGGLVAVCGGGQLTIVDCLFDGSLTGSNCYANGGFVGWGDGKIVIVNGHFAPSKIETKYDGCRTWARMRNFANLTVTNSYFTKSYDESTTDLYVIRSKDDWTTFKNAAAAANGKKDVNALLDTDLSLTNADMIGGYYEYAYRGTFDGNGHTLNITLESSESQSLGLFRYVTGSATFKNLRVTGSVKSTYDNNHTVSTLVGQCDYQCTNLNIDHVHVSADVTVAGGYAGGLVASSWNMNCKVNISDCLYDGKFSTYYDASCFIAQCHIYTANLHQTRMYERSSTQINPQHHQMNNWYGKNGQYYGDYSWSDTDYCLSSHAFKEVPEEYRSITDQNKVIELMNASLPGQWEKDGSGNAVPIISMTSARLQKSFGPGWQIVSGKVVPKTVTVNVNPSSLPNFYHEGTGRISKNLLTQTRQSSVVLTWAVEGGVVDYFKVYRRVWGTTEWGEPIATNIDKMGYEDTTVSPLLTYEYKVVAVADCEGLHTSETNTVKGACKNTGRVSGYVRMNDGTGVAGIEVEIAPQTPSNSPEGGGAITVTTDEKGYFVADELSYYGQQSITYVVTPVSRDGIKLETGRESYPVTFDDKSNDETLPEFTITSGHRFSGYVMYEGTSIPVKGARFRVDGRELHNAAGDYVETDYDGSFSFRVLGGNRRIQVTMDGHDFTNDGYFKGEGGHVFTDDVAQIYFYDATKVRLAGRVVGGDDQGRLPLQNNLSRNNLGDDLTMVLTLEGDNTSWLLYDNLNPTLAERTDSIIHSGGKHKTKYTVQRKRMEVKPDPVTGEYELLLPPVRWKVQQIYCKGYATLFQDGQVSEVVDLTNCLAARDSTYEGTFVSVDSVSVYQPRETCNARYSRIYHAPVEITYRQLGYDTFSYFGDKSYTATTVGGTSAEVPLAYQNILGYEDGIIGYEKVIVGYKDAVTGNTIVFDENETHKPKLTGTDGIYSTWYGDGSKTEFLYDYLFDGDLNTWWLTNINLGPAWVEFKTDNLVSVKQYTMTTVKHNGSRAGSCPKSWTLKARANETDVWTTISVGKEGQLKDNESKAYTFDVADEGSYQYFRLEVSATSWGSSTQLAELSLTCRGKEGTCPVPDYDRKPIYGKKPILVEAVYTFGYPVFSVGRSYPIEISVGERYIYNNDARTKKVDRVSVGGGTVTVHNGMKNGLDIETVELNADGQGICHLFAEATPRLLTGEDALRTVTMTLTQDGTTYEAEPLRGYVLNMFATGEAKDVLVADKPVLIDILRDPPGGSSSATLSKGSTLKYSYTLDMSLTAGLHLSIGTGKEVDNYTGSVATAAGVGTTSGVINSAQSTEWVDMEYAFDMEGHKGYTYTVNVDQDITTSGEAGMVGANADLYIGTTQNIVVTTMSTIRAIPDNMYQQMLGRLNGGTATGTANPYGSLVHIAEGTDAEGNKYHLVRDESLGYGPKLKSQFIHSQKHIVKELIPAKAKELRALMFTGTAADAQAKANATGKPVYRSLRKPDDERFALMNTKGGEIFYYTSTMAEDTTMNYVIHLPQGNTGSFSDEVADISQIIYAWMQMIAQNEYEKIAAYDLVANYDVDGGSTVSYSESFESEYDITNYYHLPGIVGADYFDDPGSDTGTTIAAEVGIRGADILLKKLWESCVNKSASGEAHSGRNDDTGRLETTVEFFGASFKFSLLPILNYSTKDVSGESKAYSRKESFSIGMNKLSHLNFDVYRVQTDTASVKAGSMFDVFTSYNFTDMTNLVNKNLQRGFDINLSNFRYPRGFVYRTRGGATCNPWEDARHTQLYKPGYLLDERTKKIENPKITVDRQSVSGVPYGEPARFTVYLTNDSEDPEAANKTISTFNLYASDTANPYGAKITCDGKPLDSSGRSIILAPGEVVTKVIEVTGGNSFDLEGLAVGICSDQDWRQIYDELTLDVHYLHQAGPVNISLPGDKWVMNTYAEKDDRGWFLPVTIDGFDRHQHNFDHIEFQYKESLRGDDAWTNLCSYYADSLLMKAASGEREMIPENGNIETHFYGEGTVMEKAYDLRAVLYCRNGNAFLTTASPIVSGVKDTRRPQLFGTPEPKDGILRLGDNIIFNFSEDIEYNYLSAITNFEVKGEVNNQNVSEAVSVQFSEVAKASVESEAQRNFSGKDLTIDLMIRPDATGRDMPLFSHGTNGKRLQLWLTSDYKLKAVIDDQTFVSTDTIAKGGFTQVAVSISQADSTLTFYNGGMTIGHAKLTEPYNGTGRLIFGRTNETDRSKSQYYQGRMMEARLWYRAMTGGQVGTTYGSQRLTGYETGLVDYYPMNEGTGDYALDHTQGANAQLIGASWAMPRGWSLHLEFDDKGLELKQQALARTAEQDYTLMFWFKTDAKGRGVLVSNGAGTKDETGATNLFNIAFEAEKLMYRSNGMAVEVPGDWSDGQWHHLAMTVNRAHSLANIYVDQTLRATFATDSLGGISGGHPLIGAARSTRVKADGTLETIDTRNWLKGNIDELCLFAQALPLTLIKAYATKSPQGDEAGLLTYLAFDRQERQKDNEIETVAYVYSKKIYKDDMGNIRYEKDPVTNQDTQTPVRDYVFVGSADEILAHISDETAAPVVPYEELHNLKFGYAGKDNQVLVELDELASRINRRNIYVTMRDVEDKNGNAMASPQTACYYVTNSSLRWQNERQTWLASYGMEEYIYFDIINNSATSHTYTIENCPRWLDMEAYTGIIGPLGTITVRGVVNKGLNVGTYDEIIYLTDEDGVTEPLYLNLTVTTSEPDWAWSVDSDLLKHSMNIAGQVYLNGEIDIDTRDIVGVFGNDGRCHGFTHINYSALTGEAGLYLTVYDSEPSGKELFFKLWQYSTGRELMLTVDGGSTLSFRDKAVLGTDTPVRFEGGSMYVQTFDLKEGWNWVSFNVASEKLFNLNTLLDGLPWQEGDVLTDMNSDLTLVYKNSHWLSSEQISTVSLSPRKAYAIMVQQDIHFPVAGNIIKQLDARTIELKQGWNGIGYTPMLNLTVETALSDYYDKAQPGDVIKSHDEFAYFTTTGGVGRWRGSLEYMKPGEGYMLLRKAEGATTFTYPFYEPGSTFLDEWSYSTARAAAPARAKATMSVSAVVEGFETEDGDRLIAYANGEIVGASRVHSGSAAETADPLYLTIGGNMQQGIWFAIERDGEIVASTSEQMTFKANAVIGSPDEPTKISFVQTDRTDGKWHTVSGIQLPKRPTLPGVYIFNGKKVVIK